MNLNKLEEAKQNALFAGGTLTYYKEKLDEKRDELNDLGILAPILHRYKWKRLKRQIATYESMVRDARKEHCTALKQYGIVWAEWEEETR